MKRHALQAHSNEAKEIQPAVARYKCLVCLKQFPTPYKIQRHMRIHIAKDGKPKATKEKKEEEPEQVQKIDHLRNIMPLENDGHVAWLPGHLIQTRFLS